AGASSLLSTYLSAERCGHRERAVRDLQWKCGQPPRRRPEHDLRALARVEFRVVTRTLEDVLVAAFGFHPFRDGTPGMRANRRIGDDAAGRARAGVLIELARIEPDDHDLVQSRALADDRGFRVLRPGMDGWTARLQIGGLDDRAGLFSVGQNEQVTFLRPLIAAGRILLVFAARWTCRETGSGGKRRQKKRASRLFRTAHRPASSLANPGIQPQQLQRETPPKRGR